MLYVKVQDNVKRCGLGKHKSYGDYIAVVQNEDCKGRNAL